MAVVSGRPTVSNLQKQDSAVEGYQQYGVVTPKGNFSSRGDEAATLRYLHIRYLPCLLKLCIYYTKLKYTDFKLKSKLKKVRKVHRKSTFWVKILKVQKSQSLKMLMMLCIFVVVDQNINTRIQVRNSLSFNIYSGCQLLATPTKPRSPLFPKSEFLMEFNDLTLL